MEPTYEKCAGCWHFIEPNDTGGDPAVSAFAHLDDGEKDHDHDAAPSGDQRTLAQWRLAKPDLFAGFPDGKIGPNSAHFRPDRQARAIVPAHRSQHMCSTGCACRSWACTECGTDRLVDRRMRYETEPESPDQYAVELCDACGAPLCDQCVLAASHECEQMAGAR